MHPDVKNYRPNIKESVLDTSLVSLEPNDKRQDLFKNKIFIFPTKTQFDTLREVVISAGGEAYLLTLNGNYDKLGNKNIVVIQLPSNKSQLSESFMKEFESICGEFLL